MTTRRIAPIAALLIIAWVRLPPSERAYLRSILRQLPDLPARYVV